VRNMLFFTNLLVPGGLSKIFCLGTIKTRNQEHCRLDSRIGNMEAESYN
jgi:hypothetical protein